MGYAIPSPPVGEGCEGLASVSDPRVERARGRSWVRGRVPAGTPRVSVQ
jgi:hypothetical protein